MLQNHITRCFQAIIFSDDKVPEESFHAALDAEHRRLQSSSL